MLQFVCDSAFPSENFMSLQQCFFVLELLLNNSWNQLIVKIFDSSQWVLFLSFLSLSVHFQFSFIFITNLVKSCQNSRNWSDSSDLCIKLFLITLPGGSFILTPNNKLWYLVFMMDLIYLQRYVLTLWMLDSNWYFNNCYTLACALWHNYKATLND